METPPTSSYQPPVDKLLRFGKGQSVVPSAWPNYLSLGFGPEHVPELIRMATDKELNQADSESLEVWAPTHAWRTLGQLRAEEAIEPLLGLFDDLKDDDWVMSELPEVYGMIGPVALPALSTYLADPSHTVLARAHAITCVEQISKGWPESRNQCVALLMEHLESFDENDPELNADLIGALVELQAKESAPLIKQAFAANSVDTFTVGDWDYVQVELGLKSVDEIAQEQLNFLPVANQMAYSPVSSATVRERKVTHHKAKHKMAKQSRKKNRKR